MGTNETSISFDFIANIAWSASTISWVECLAKSINKLTFSCSIEECSLSALDTKSTVKGFTIRINLLFLSNNTLILFTESISRIASLTFFSWNIEYSTGFWNSLTFLLIVEIIALWAFKTDSSIKLVAT